LRGDINRFVTKYVSKKLKNKYLWKNLFVYLF
jgi:hypothetical protein